MVLMFLVIIGAINWGACTLGFNLVEAISKGINNIFHSKIPIDKIIYLTVALAGIWLANERDTWLPFLGNTVFPGSLVPLVQPIKSDTSITIKTKPNVKIAYWAALNKGDTTNVYSAYGNYENSGVVMSDANGNAVLPIMTGTGYTIPSGEVLPRHVHYRMVNSSKNYGMMGKINTVSY
jgi:uncharacterized membrane protein YuzA (DUF378 family)